MHPLPTLELREHTMEPIAIVAGLVVVVALGVLLNRRGSRARATDIEEVFAGRQQLASDEWWEQEFSKTGIPNDVVVGVRKVLEKVLDADMSRLRSTDDFSTNLAFFSRHDSMADVEIVVALEREFRIAITDEEARNSRTVSDLVNLVARKRAVAQ